MLYSIVGILAIFVHLIVNIDIFFNVKGKKKHSLIRLTNVLIKT